MSISCKPCQIHRCTHLAFIASVQIDSPEEEVIPPSDSEEELSSGYSNTNIGNYEPPPFPSGIDSKDFSEDSNETTNENDEIDSPNSYRLEETPIVNYSGDYQNEDDYFEGWTWNCYPGQEDSEPEYGQATSLWLQA